MKLQPWGILLIAAASAGVVAAQEYEGPTVLSRSGGGVQAYGARLGEEPKMRVFVGVEAIYDYGFLPISTNSTGGVSKFGGQVGYTGRVGVYGTKRWRRTSLGVDYTGVYRGYTKQTYYNGADNFLGLEFGDQLTRSSLLTGTLTAGTASRAFSLGSALIGSPLGNVLPTTDIFDARTYFITGGMGISHEINSRLGFEVRSDAYRVERHSTALVSAQGYSPKASVSYRYSRRISIGGIYNFYHYEYPRAFGETNVHVAMGFFNYEISRTWKLETQGGVFFANSAGTRNVAADPIVQQLLGVTMVSEAYSRVVALPNAQVRLYGKSGNSIFILSAYRGVGAGNGITLSSSEQSGIASYYYVLSKNLRANVQATYTGAAGLGNTADRYTTISGGAGMNYASGGHVTYSINALYRRSTAKSALSFNSDSYEIGVGAGWNFRDIPGFR